MSCDHDPRFSGVFLMPKSYNGCVACGFERESTENNNREQIILDIKKLIINDSHKTVTAKGKQQMMNQIWNWCQREV